VRIGELARRSGRSVHTIRYYETLRLMPNVFRDAAGRRVYTEGHVAWLEFLGRLKQSGMSIRDMRVYTALVGEGDGSLSKRRTFLRAHRQRVTAAIDDLRGSVAAIDRKIAFYSRRLDSKQKPIDTRATAVTKRG
jgi:DNA-binding transcriptional MerR regulator